jgi:cell division protein FtsW (lipid II flippase)
MALDYVTDAAAAGRARRRREAADVASFIRSLDWLLIGAVAAVVAYGLWAIAGITRHDIPGNPDYYVVRQGVFVAVGTVALLVAIVIDPEWYRRRWRAIFVGTASAIAVVYVFGPVRGS